VFVENVRKLEVMIGSDETKEPIGTEEISRLNARRSIVLDADVKEGDALTEAILTYKRPGTGVSPVHWDAVIGRRVARDLERDHVLQWEDLA
jgi:sialic acid synthase SpsE